MVFKSFDIPITDIFKLENDIIENGKYLSSGTRVRYAIRLCDEKEVVIKSKEKQIFRSKSNDDTISLKEIRWYHHMELLIQMPRHPHICPILELLEDELYYHVVMEKLDGLNLQNLVQEFRFQENHYDLKKIPKSFYKPPEEEMKTKLPWHHHSSTATSDSPRSNLRAQLKRRKRSLPWDQTSTHTKIIRRKQRRKFIGTQNTPSDCIKSNTTHKNDKKSFILRHEKDDGFITDNYNNGKKMMLSQHYGGTTDVSTISPSYLNNTETTTIGNCNHSIESSSSGESCLITNATSWYSCSKSDSDSSKSDLSLTLLIDRMKIGRVICRDILYALQHLHNHGIIHRDLSLPNIILITPLEYDTNSSNEGFAVLIDFDTIDAWDNRDKRIIRKRYSLIGTNQYIAPESYQGIYTPKSDIFQLGIVLYQLLTSRSCFPQELFNISHTPSSQIIGSSAIQSLYDNLCDAVQNINWDIKIFDNHPFIRDLLKKMLDVNENERISIQDALNHPWLTNF